MSLPDNKLIQAIRNASRDCSMGTDTFYFVVFDSEPDTLTVIDLAHSVSYQRSDWNFIDDQNFITRDAAIMYARDVAKANDLKYKPFESRYDSSLNEPKISIDPHTLVLNTDVY